jgi:hypothetical protein
MALTAQQAKQAGQIAATIDLLTASIAAAQQAVALGVTIQSYNATGNLSGSAVPLACTVPMSYTDSATILNALITIYQSNLNALNTQLAAM